MADARPLSSVKIRPSCGKAQVRPIERAIGAPPSSIGRPIRHETMSLSIDSKLSPSSLITIEEIEAICLLLGDDLGALFND